MRLEVWKAPYGWCEKANGEQDSSKNGSSTIAKLNLSGAGSWWAGSGPPHPSLCFLLDGTRSGAAFEDRRKKRRGFQGSPWGALPPTRMQ